MNQLPFHRRALKHQAKQTFFRYLRPCVAASCLLILFSLLTQLFSQATGGALYFLLLDHREYPMQTGLWPADPATMSSLLSVLGIEALGRLGGLVLSISDEVGGLVFVLPLGWLQLGNMLLVRAAVFLVTVPLQYGAVSQFYRILLGRPAPFRSLLDWYLDLRLAAKALVTQVLVALWRGLTSLLCLLPGMLCLAAGSALPGFDWLLLPAPLLLLAGMTGGYFLYLTLLPAHYLLAKQPSLSVSQAFASARRLLRGRKLPYFLLNLSFLPWHLLSLYLAVTSPYLSSLIDIFLLPYISLTNLLFLDMLEREAPPL